MRILKSMRNLFSRTPIPPQRKPFIIYGREIQNSLYDNVFPWANEKVENTEITISNLILLWVVSRYNIDFSLYPTHLKRNYGISNPKERVLHLISLGLVDNNYIITDLGIEFIDANRYYIELHKKGWVSSEERKINQKNHSIFHDQYSEWLESMGFSKESSIVRENITKEKKRSVAYERFKQAEKLAKMKQFSESNLLLLPLKDDNIVDFYAPLYERIAKNYRGLKEYQLEIDTCTYFLQHLQPLYGGNMWKDVFNKRIAFAKNKLK